MKLALYGDYQLGVLRDEQIIDVMPALEGESYHSPQRMMEIVITEWDEISPKIEAAAERGDPQSIADVTFCPPMPRPGQLVCLAGNYLEPQKPERGTFNAFLKSNTGVMGHRSTVVLPPADVSWFHFEPELAIVIGKTGEYLTEENAMETVFGYTQFIDASARGLPGGFFLGKSWHTFGPMGPAIVTKDEVPEPNNLKVQMHVNGELRHDLSTSDMDRHIPELLVEVTKVLRLEPGDVVSTGTHHFGLKPIEDGDELVHDIECLGPNLCVTVHDELKRTSWGEQS
ncbi:MAG: fumarylacetoacetate hydrolase family protein [Planctomycetota bacterium]|jgi:2-keto-4-pentenoate hydratase/2-oxohepta-3-ene-1,7-dioic acid hydratase in catechol pathway|nr:fumarylacetoacetate hydrolase family protein [Planctomycetota bacterium]